MSRLKSIIAVCFTAGLLVLFASEMRAIENQGLPYLRFFQIPIMIRNLTDLENDRVVFHSFNVVDEKGRWIHTSSPELDNSLSTLLVIRSDKVYILRDGYENPEVLQEAKKAFWVDELAWQNQKIMIRKFQELYADVSRLETQGGPGHPQTQQAQRNIDVFLAEYDTEYRGLLARHEIEKRKLYSHRINFGIASPEYQAQKKVLAAVDVKVKERNKNLRQSLIALGKAHESEAQAQPDTSIEILKRPPPFERQSFYVNAVDGTPDYVLVGDRNGRVPDLERLDVEERQWVQQNFADFYKTVRDAHLKRYINQYKDLISRPTKYNARVRITRHVLLKNFLTGEAADRKNTTVAADMQEGNITEVKEEVPAGEEDTARTVEFLRVDAVGNDGTIYTVIDADGNGITETFLVKEPGTFHWGTVKAPNVVSIFNNREPEVEKLIGDLVAFARRGGDESEMNLVQKKAELQKEVLDCIQQEENISRVNFKVNKENPVFCRDKLKD